MALADAWTLSTPGEVLSKLTDRDSRIIQSGTTQQVTVRGGGSVFQVQDGVLEQVLATGRVEYDRYDSSPFFHLWMLRTDTRRR